jgi:tRNA (guanine-N7-)-methyltransferase
MAGSSDATIYPLRAVRSFVRREGRITPGQRRAIEQLAEIYCVDGQETPLNLSGLFGRQAPYHLEIGCGAGETILALARQHPENNYLGIEVFRPGIGRLLHRAAADGLTNIRIIQDDAVATLETQIPDASLEGIYIFFPDPWPKKRHHKRRLVQKDFALLLKRKLLPHGRIFIATDWADYADQIVEVMEAQAGFTNLAGPGNAAPRPRWRPTTRYERRALGLGHTVRDFVFVCN